MSTYRFYRNADTFDPVTKKFRQPKYTSIKANTYEEAFEKFLKKLGYSYVTSGDGDID